MEWKFVRTKGLHEIQVALVRAISQGAVAMMAVLVVGGTSLPLSGDGGMFWMVGISAAYLTVGIVAFGLSEHRARRRGSLARY